MNDIVPLDVLWAQRVTHFLSLDSLLAAVHFQYPDVGYASSQSLFPSKGPQLTSTPQTDPRGSEAPQVVFLACRTCSPSFLGCLVMLLGAT